MYFRLTALSLVLFCSKKFPFSHIQSFARSLFLTFRFRISTCRLKSIQPSHRNVIENSLTRVPSHCTRSNILSSVDNCSIFARRKSMKKKSIIDCREYNHLDNPAEMFDVSKLCTRRRCEIKDKNLLLYLLYYLMSRLAKANII